MNISTKQLKQILKEIVSQIRLTENIQDPTKDEMFNYLRSLYGNEEGFRDDAEVAIYWFSNFYHGGQSSNLYSALSTSRFRPGPASRGPQPQSSEEMMYDDLVLHFAPNTEEATAIKRKHAALNEVYIPLSEKNPYAVYGKGDATSWSAGWRFLGASDSIENAIKQYPNAEFIKINPGQHNDKTVWTKKNGTLNEAISPKSVEVIKKWQEQLKDNRKVAVKLVDYVIGRLLGGMSSSDLPDTTIFADGLDQIEVFLEDGNYDSALEYAKDTAKEMLEDLQGELQENNDSDHEDDLETRDAHRKQFHSKYQPQQKSTTKKSDMDWKRVKKNIDKGTLKQESNLTTKDLERFAKNEKNPFVQKAMDVDADYVEYVGPWGQEKPFTLKTPNGVEKFEFCKGRYPSGKEDLAVYAYRGDVCYGYQTWRKMHGLDGHMG